jgi:hypothetical protein
MAVGGQRHAPAAFLQGKTLVTQCTGGWVGNRTGLEKVMKISPIPGFDPRAIEPVPSRYTNCAIRAYISLLK